MNIRDITSAQQPTWNPLTGKYIRSASYFAQYSAFCMSRRSYKRGKGLTRSINEQSKRARKDRVYAAKLKARKRA